jgi:hypothetical protein
VPHFSTLTNSLLFSKPNFVNSEPDLNNILANVENKRKRAYSTTHSGG